ncbi:protein-L-isoaspartate O-methyltransferase family protein [Maritalea mediterranea]|uniref:Protein-L-isoaspartate O-methyltransferase n=1 Tax=Maritalea mediterranea TaxID=2909667 RepID=A0ABS9E630_9HYPH|nr:protein-L-isoaspartate O-methyltransferase [Maritalea mediterranea]MCF4098267.1 protein-L-isoaspartate O-methyltransferase [Maritalea mediterranea]
MDFEHARKSMVDCQLRPNAVTDYRILAAMSEIPRENFVPAAKKPLAYLDEDLPLDTIGARKMMEPMYLARLAQLAEIKSSDLVLHVACNTGYGTAVIAQFADSVMAIDDNEDFVEMANDALADLEVGNAAVLAGELKDGLAKEAPFDVIFVEGHVDELPETLFKQLKQDGRLVCVETENGVPSAVCYVKNAAGVSRRVAFNAVVPKLVAFEKQKTFTF